MFTPENPCKFTGIHFAHMHMGDLLRRVHEHPCAEIAAIYHPERSEMESAIHNFNIPQERVYTDFDACMQQSQADAAILCAPTGEHADWTERIAPYGVNLFVEKPFAASLTEADRMIAAMEPRGKQMMINWPMRWYPTHVTAKRLIEEGRIGEVKQVHYYDGNRGPLYHGADKVELEPTPERKARSWFYRKEQGGGSLLDYLGYGVTLGSWFHNGKAPLEITSMVDQPTGLEVDEHSVTVARYDSGLSKFETRWGTFTDPWVEQPQPKCGFVITGTEGTISCYDLEPHVTLQTRKEPKAHTLPVDTLEGKDGDPIAYFINCLETGEAPDGPLGVELARLGQRMVDTALRSAAEKRTLPLIG